jgi:hypothetical protein
MKDLKYLQDAALRMQNYLEEQVNNDPVRIMQRMEELQILIAKSGNYLADSKYLQDKAKLDAIREVVNNDEYHNKSTTVINKFIDARGMEFNHLVNWYDRINSAAGKQHQGLITILSFIKSQLAMV